MMNTIDQTRRLADKLCDVAANNTTKLLTIAMMLDYTPKDEDDLEEVLEQIKGDISALFTMLDMWEMCKFPETYIV